MTAIQPDAESEADSHQISIRVPKPLWKRVEAAMSYEGISSFGQFARSALTHHVRTIEDRSKGKKTGDSRAP